MFAGIDFTEVPLVVLHKRRLIESFGCGILAGIALSILTALLAGSECNRNPLGMWNVVAPPREPAEL
jgi:hypothetical protein